MQSRSRDGLLLKKQLIDQEGFSELSAHIGKLPMPSEDGKMRGTEVANMTTVLRIVQSIQSKKVEPIRQWLAPEEATRWQGRRYATVRSDRTVENAFL
jgi:hypothetical protein